MEGLLSTGPTPSSLLWKTNKNATKMFVLRFNKNVVLYYIARRTSTGFKDKLNRLSEVKSIRDMGTK